jgi:hypothetical protein
MFYNNLFAFLSNSSCGIGISIIFPIFLAHSGHKTIEEERSAFKRPLSFEVSSVVYSKEFFLVKSFDYLYKKTVSKYCSSDILTILFLQQFNDNRFFGVYDSYK